MTVATESPVCFYHRAASGETYAAADRCRSRPTDDAAEVLASFPTAARLRVIGVVENAEFMLACRKQRPDVMIEVGGPGLCLYADELRRPEVVIQRMRQALLSGSLGGFHRWRFPDLAAYQLAHFLRCDKTRTLRVRQAAEVHPAWYDLGFLPTLNKGMVPWLLGMLIDPRWYIDLKHPNRLNRVQSFLGLSPGIQRRVAAGAADDDVTRRCALVKGCWAASRADVAAPGNFLWRIRAAASDHVIGDLRASQAFVSYLIRTWQQRIVVETMPHLREPLFVPERFFHRGDVDEVRAYNDFAAKRRDGPQDFGSP